MAVRQQDPIPGRVLRLARGLLGLTQRGFAERIHLKRKTLAKAEAGGRPVEGFLFQDAARAAGLPPTALVILSDVARGASQLDDEQRAWLAGELLDAALRGLRDRGGA